MRWRLLTFNIAHGRGMSLYQGWHSERALRRNLQRIGALLRQTQADVVALQEVDADSHWNRGLNLLEILRQESGLPFAELAVTNERQGLRKLLYGNGLLSRWPLHHWEPHCFDDDSPWNKGFLWAEVELPDGSIVPLLNLHLDFASRRRRITQVEAVVRHLVDKSECAGGAGKQWRQPLICGDFNSRASKARDAVRHLRHHLPVAAGYRLEPRRARTFPTIFPTAAIDFAFIPQPWHIVRVEVCRTWTSDHRPVLVELGYPG